jgi:hypothetical protein
VWLRPVLGWLACAAARHAFPSTGDAQSLWRALWGRRGAGWLARLVGTPLVGVLYVGAWGAWVWLDVAYAVLCGAVLPWWLTHGR